MRQEEGKGYFHEMMLLNFYYSTDLVLLGGYFEIEHESLTYLFNKPNLSLKLSLIYCSFSLTTLKLNPTKLNTKGSKLGIDPVHSCLQS